MKKWIILLCSFVILSAVMFETKPSQDHYTDWLLENISYRMEGESPLMTMGISLFGEQMVENHTEVNDYLLFNTFKTEFRGKELKFIGVFHTFIPLSLDKE
ncbi:DUF4359 domain-containing protein [Rossellomorea aquimaris]|uniref:DUF4359 domain-containing protein n=1 Tax=Rossellomorea aquimaris TaxID=189382 RepID=UPI001CD3EB97|nr:DUF4359 domain-containing protein [Rossellomorea aquimaris]MCA1060403.1 DUF4359 domain-containing protein [Rossellomorea aquimaris]